MAQDADGTRQGSRSAAGSKREGKSFHQSGQNPGKGGDKPDTTPVHQSGDRGATNGDGRGVSGAVRTGPSSNLEADGNKGQQPGRKKRRSRSRHRRGGSSSSPGPNGNAQPKSLDSLERGSTSDRTANSSARADDTSARGNGSDASPQSHRNESRSEPRDEDNKARSRNKSRRRSKSGRANDKAKQQNQTNAVAKPAPSGDKPDQAKGKADNRTAHPDQGRRHGQNASRHAHVGHQNSNSVYAALDLGTNNCRLLVAEPHGQSFRVVDAFSRIVRLGEGLSQSGRLSDDAQERAIAALKVCQSKLSYRSVKRFRLIATEACRRASNGAAFLNRVYRETGLKLEIVDRETEARLAVSGCASLVHPDADGVVLFDIGGGSSEIVWLDLDPLNDEVTPQPGEKRNRQTRRALRHLSERIRCWTSLQVGVVTLSEKHGGQVVTREHFEAMVAEVREMLGHFEEREALAKAIQSKHIHMLGTSGTVTTLAGVHLGLERYDRRQVDGTWLSAQELRAMIARILEMDFNERINNPCIGQDRADLVLAGCAILEALHREWPCARLRVADRGLREGILMEMMIDDGVWTQQNAGKSSAKKRRPRRRGGRGHRGGQGHKQAQTSAQSE